MSHAKQRIGLLGGSFNPAHDGHVHISLEAIKRLKLDEVWWLVSPKNPLKKASDLADVTLRLNGAKAITKTHPRIVVRDDEITHGLYYTIDSIVHLQAHYRATQFVWLMGADNLKHFHRWKGHAALAARIPIAVLDRAPYSFGALASRTALRLRHSRISPKNASLLAGLKAPAWVYIPIPRHPLSATFLRKTLGLRAFFGHNTK